MILLLLGIVLLILPLYHLKIFFSFCNVGMIFSNLHLGMGGARGLFWLPFWILGTNDYVFLVLFIILLEFIPSILLFIWASKQIKYAD